MIQKLSWRVFVLSVFILAGCSPKTEYTSALPKDASVVASIDLASLAQKSGMNGEEGAKLTEKLLPLIQSGLTGEAAQLAEKLVKNPQESGLALDQKAYFFATPNATAMGVLAKVNDPSRLEEMLGVLAKEQIATALKEESGCHWSQVGQAICAFNGSSFLLVQHSHGDASSIQGSVLRWMRQQPEESFTAKPAYASMQEEQGDITSYVNLSVVPSQYTTVLRMGLPGTIGVEDISYLLSLRLDTGKVGLSARSFIQDESMNRIFQQMDECTQPIAGKYLPYFPANLDLWMGGNIHGKELYDLMASHPLLRRELENPKLPVDVKRIFSALKGDIAIGYTSLLQGDFLAYADVESADFLQTFEDLRPLFELSGGQLSLETLGKNQYVLHTYLGPYWFGVRNELCYVTNSETLAEEAGRNYGVSLQQRPWSGTVSQQRFVMASQNLNFKNAVRFIETVPGLASVPGATVLLATLLQCDTFTWSVPTWDRSEFTFYLKDSQKNLLQTLMRLWK